MVGAAVGVLVTLEHVAKRSSPRSEWTAGTRSVVASVPLAVVAAVAAGARVVVVEEVETPS